MSRNLDLTALRSFVVVAETGGVTRAAGFLNLTQSAVSMQIKRLEEMLGLKLLDRSARQIALTGEGEQLLSYARKMLELNDEVYSRLTATEFEGEIVLGVPHDLVYPVIPPILQRFAQAYPRVKVRLLSSYTAELKDKFSRGEADVILTTENDASEGGETLCEKPLVWIGAPGGSAWRTRPLRLAYENKCLFRAVAQAALDKAGVPWELVVESESTRTIEASVSADLAIYTALEGSASPHMEEIQHGGTLPSLPFSKINMYMSDVAPVAADLAEMVRQAYRGGSVPRLLNDHHDLAS